MKDKYSIRIITNIHDQDIVLYWKKIQEGSECFPQMYYEWCEPWWRLRSGNRKLHIVAVEDGNGKIVGIAPLCMERRIGVCVLLSFPVHFCDFYGFIVEAGPQEGEITASIIKYLKSFAAWDIVHLMNVNDRSPGWAGLKKEGFLDKVLTDILASDFHDLSFEKFLATLSRNTRSQFHKKLRRLEREGQVGFLCIEDATGYMAHVDEMKRLYNARWIDDHSLLPDDLYYQCRNEAVQALCKIDKIALFLLTLDGRMIVFRLGFMHANVFYDWKVSHDPRFDKFSPGILIMGKIIEELISRGYTQFNFMTGDYPYKRSWVPQGAESRNYELFACGRSVHARFYMKYRLVWRDKLRGCYHVLLENRLVRIMNRKLQAWRRGVKA